MAYNRITGSIARALAPESNDFLHLDVIRFIAAVGVVILHYSDAIGISDRLQGLQYFVDLFFIISGFVIASVYGDRLNNQQQYNSFLQKRVARLVPLHWLVLLGYLGICTAGAIMGIAPQNPERFDPACIVPNILLIQSFGICEQLTFNYVSWSISAEMAMYLLAPVFLLLARHRIKALALAAFFILMLSLTDSDKPWYQWTANGGVLRAIPSFLFGMVLANNRHYLRFLPAASHITWALLAAFILLVPFAAPSLLVVLVYMIGITAIAADARGYVPNWVRASVGSGQLTYSIYMLHPIVYTVSVQMIGNHMLHLQGHWQTLWIVLTAFLLVPVSIASLMLFETPTRRWISGLGQNRGALRQAAAGRGLRLVIRP